jgi:putative DNA primase/helicase
MGGGIMTAVSREQRHTRTHRCPICDGADQDPRGKNRRCAGYTNEEAGYSHCSREDVSGGIVGKEVQGVTLFAHKLHGACNCGVEHGPAREEPRSTIEATYPYLDESGVLLFEVVRKPPKRFLQRKPNGIGGWDWKLGDTRRVLYRLPKLLAADVTRTVYIVEGEKDVASLETIGLLATCNPGGAGKWSAVAEQARTVLADRTIVIVADKDAVGRKHALEIRGSLAGSTIFEAPDPHKDVSDLLGAGGKITDLVPFVVPELAPTAPPSSPPPTPFRVVPASDLPEIRLGASIHRMADDAIAALANDSTIYQRANQLVHVVRSVEPPRLRDGSIVRDAGVPIIRPVALPTLKERLSACALWLRYLAKEKKCVPAAPSDAASKAVFSRGEWKGIPSLVGTTTAPTFRSDGSILQGPGGFDEATGLLYQPNADYPAVPPEPSRDDARDAYRALCAVTELGDGGFPFAAAHHKAAWVCSVLSILARTAIDGPVPLFAIDANTRGTGKSILADAAIRIALGHPAARMSYPEDDTEMRKRITTLVLDGDQTALIDNVSRKLGGENIEAAMTSTVWKDRILGSMTSIKAPMLIVWFATGNGLDYTSDMRTRAVHIRLESPLENPEARRMPDLFAWIETRRHHLVTWALTILRAWHVAGRPRSTKTIGRFASWGALIPQAVAWASDVDPTHAFAADDPEADSDRMAIDAVLACVEHLGKASTRQIVTALYGSGDRHDGATSPDLHVSFAGARDAIELITHCKPGNSPDTKRLATYFHKIEGRVVANRRLVRLGVTAGVQTWGVKRV